jgi:hypothetical protein
MVVLESHERILLHFNISTSSFLLHNFNWFSGYGLSLVTKF